MNEFKPVDLFDEGTEQLVEKKQSAVDEQVSEEQVASSEQIGKPTAHKEEISIKMPPLEDFSETAEEPNVEGDGQLKYEHPLEQVLKAVSSISEQIADLTDTFNAKIMHSAYEEKIIDQMHGELQKYKKDMYAQLVRPILLDIIEVRDSIMRVGAVYREKPEDEQNIPHKTFSDYAYDLQDILEKNNVEIYRSQTGDDFTPIKQKVVQKVSTGDQSLHGKIAQSISCGYSYQGQTISAEKISIYYYEKPVENDEKAR